MSGDNDNGDGSTETPGNVVSLSDRRDLAAHIMDHAAVEGVLLQREIERWARAVCDHAQDYAGYDHNLTTTILVRALQLADADDLTGRAERILGPRRNGPHSPAPESA